MNTQLIGTAFVLTCALLVTENSTAQIAWKAELGGDCGPITIHGGKVLIGTLATSGTNALLICLEESTGAEVWRFECERLPANHLDNHSVGIRCNAAVKGRYVVIYTNRAEIVCLDIHGKGDGTDDGELDDCATADILWRHDLRSDFGVFKRDMLDVGAPTVSPVIIDDLVVAATGNGSTLGIERFYEGRSFIPAPAAPAVVAFELKTGIKKWTNNDASRKVVYGSIGTPLSIGNGELIFAGGDQQLIGIDKNTGVTLWNASTEEASPWTWHTPVDCKSSVVVVGSPPPGLAFGRPSIITAYHRSQKSNREFVAKWTLRPEGFEGSYVPAICFDGRLYVLTTSRELLVVDAHRGQLIERHELEFELDFPQMMRWKDWLIVPVGDELIGIDTSSADRPNLSYKIGVDVRSNIVLTKQYLFCADRKYVYAINPKGIQDHFPGTQ